MIKLSELVVTPQNITPEKVYSYFHRNIKFNNNEFDIDSDGWKEYKELSKPYIEKYDIFGFLSTFNEFEKLSKPDLNKFYQEMRTLVRKHVGKETLNELQVKPQNITPEKVHGYFHENIRFNNNEFGSDSKGWREYIEICKPYGEKYNIPLFLSTFNEFKKLSQPELNKFYKDIRALVRKHVGKKIISELQVTPQGITLEKAHLYYINNIWSNHKEFYSNRDGWKEYKELCKPYCKKYNIISSFLGPRDDFKKLSQPELNKFYQKMRALVRKHVGKEILSELQVTPQNITAQELMKYVYRRLSSEKDLMNKYKELSRPYCKKYNINSFIMFLNEFEKLSQSDLNKLYKEMKKI